MSAALDVLLSFLEWASCVTVPVAVLFSDWLE